MKGTFVAAVISALFVSHISAECICDPNDTACLDRCVIDTNSCISECKSNRECYSSCIEYHWPGVKDAPTTTETIASTTMSEQSTMTGSATTSASSDTNTATTTTTAWGSSSTTTPVWTQSGSWSSVATWAPSHSAVPSATPSTSGSSNLKAPQALAGLALVAAGYFFY